MSSTKPINIIQCAENNNNKIRYDYILLKTRKGRLVPMKKQIEQSYTYMTDYEYLIISREISLEREKKIRNF